MASRRDITAHTRELAETLLEDVELSRGTGEQLLLRASRLARLVGDAGIQAWLSMELRGYSGDELGIEWMTRTGRWVDRDKRKGWWSSLPSIEGTIGAMEQRLQSLLLPNHQGDMILRQCKAFDRTLRP